MDNNPNTSVAAPMSARQWLTAFLLLDTGFMLAVDFSILNVAMPQIGAAVGADYAQLPWRRRFPSGPHARSGGSGRVS